MTKFGVTIAAVGLAGLLLSALLRVDSRRYVEAPPSPVEELEPRAAARLRRQHLWVAQTRLPFMIYAVVTVVGIVMAVTGLATDG